MTETLFGDAGYGLEENYEIDTLQKPLHYDFSGHFLLCSLCKLSEKTQIKNPSQIML